MRKIFCSAVILCTMAVTLNAQYATRFTVTNLNNDALTSKVENAVSALFTELNQASFEKRRPKMDRAAITEDARKDLLDLWESSPFRCIESELVESGVMIPGGFQIRNIPVTMTRAQENDNYEELVVSFNSAGVITSVYISVNQYKQLLQGTNSVTDMRRRQVILEFLENFRTAYGRKDLPFLQQVYSDDALIITGRVVKQKKMDAPYGSVAQDKVQLVRQSKQQYLAGLARIFKNNEYIYLNFDEIKITQTDKFPNIYGVELKQGWNTNSYSDEGYLFLMIDFKNELQPLIHVRTWTPGSMFGLGDFVGSMVNSD